MSFTFIEKIFTKLSVNEKSISSTNDYGNPANAIAFDLPFILAQIASIIANQFGQSLIQVVIMNISFLVLAKVILVLWQKWTK